MDKKKILKKILSGSKNVQFNELILVVESFGFHLSRVRGSHHIYEHPDIPEILNLQNYRGQAKPYQINQFLTLVEYYRLEMEENKS
ncbi:MAG: type II toxin-antitoxin system HicA family toxin [Candidatus Sumerlaeota bacterium]|nr:type II toxin-antitoxin system HicA family toxin [Candidatus Sumerlaeota bacterium]